MELLSEDRSLPPIWTQVINAPFEEDDAQLGLQTMKDYLASGYRPENVHTHILILLALGRAPRQPDAAALASQSVMILHDLLGVTSKASSLAASIPTCVHGSAEAVSNYDPQHYTLLNAAKRMMANARRGFWDVVLETKGERTRWRKRQNEKAEAKAGIWTPLGSFNNKKGRKTHKDPSTEEQDVIQQEDDDTEVVSDRAWMVIDWMTRIWEKEVEEKTIGGEPVVERSRESRPAPLLFLAQIPAINSYEPRWDLSRIMAVISSAFEEGDLYEDPSWAMNEMSKFSKLALAGRLIGLAMDATLTSPRPLLSPSSLTDELTCLCEHLVPRQMECFFAIMPRDPHTLVDNVVLGVAREVLGVQGNEQRPTVPNRATNRLLFGGNPVNAISLADVESLSAACKGASAKGEDQMARLAVVGAQLDGILGRLRHV